MSASPNLKCGLCHDFLVNAVTVAGCMHSFCEECLLKNLSISGICPTKGCKKNVDKNGYRRDSTLQMLVYKFMPRIFFENAEKDKTIANAGNKKAQRELVQTTSEICDPDELLSICLEFVPAPTNAVKTEEDTVAARPSTSTSTNEPPAKKAKKHREPREIQQSFRRFFRCAAKVPIRTIRRLLETKLFLTDQFSVHFISDHDFQDISDDVTLRTLVLDGGFDRTRPFRLFFTLVPTVVDDAPPVLDAETMPCLMPEAPVHQETPPNVQPSGPIQPVQIVSPVVPALTVSLSTDIYGHSAPIITQQCAPRKRRKLSDPKKSPTEKSPTTSAPHPTPIAPNMLVGQLLRPMFIAQPPFLHRSPPNMQNMQNLHTMTIPFQPPQMPAPMECPPMRKPGPAHEMETPDRPPRLHREDPSASAQPTSSNPPTTPASTPATPQQQHPASAPATPQHHRPTSSPASSAEVNKLPLPEQPQQMMPPPPLPQPPPLPMQTSQPPPSAATMPTVASVLAEQKMPKPSPRPRPMQEGGAAAAKASRASGSQKGQQSNQKPNGEVRAIQKVDITTTRPPPVKVDLPAPSSSKELPQKNAGVLPKVQPLPSMSAPPPQKKPPRPMQPQQNGSGSDGKMTQSNISAPKPKPTVSAPTLSTPPENPRPVQPVLPQLLNATNDARTTMPSVASTAADTAPKTSNPTTNGMTGMTNSNPSASSSTSTAAKEPTPAVVNPPVTAEPPPTTTTTAAPPAPMDFRRMATLNKQSLGRTLHAVLTSGRAANAADAASKNTNGTSAAASMDVRPSAAASLNGKINKEASVDVVHYPSPKSLSAQFTGTSTGQDRFAEVPQVTRRNFCKRSAEVPNSSTFHGYSSYQTNPHHPSTSVRNALAVCAALPM